MILDPIPVRFKIKLFFPKNLAENSEFNSCSILDKCSQSVMVAYNLSLCTVCCCSSCVGKPPNELTHDDSLSTHIRTIPIFSQNMSLNIFLLVVMVLTFSITPPLDKLFSLYKLLQKENKIISYLIF